MAGLVHRRLPPWARHDPRRRASVRDVDGHPPLPTRRRSCFYTRAIISIDVLFSYGFLELLPAGVVSIHAQSPS